MQDNVKILMCGSRLDVKGGIVSVVKNYLEYNNWNNYRIKYIPTHIEKNKLILIFYFIIEYIRIIFTIVFGKFQIIYLHTAERGSFFRKAILARTMKRMGVKVVMHHHAAEFDSFYETLSVRRKNYVNKTLEIVDLNIVLSNLLVDTIKSKANNANIKVLYNAVNVYESNMYNVHANNVLFLGRLGERKGVYDLLHVIKNLDQKISPDIKFYLCGDGEIENVERWIIENKIQHRIGHVGWINNNQKSDIFKNTIINVLPSYNEGLPMSILETMAYGIPNISTKIASIPEVIKDGVNGYMILPGDIIDLEKKLLALLNDEVLRNRFSEIAWDDITTNFSLESNICILKEYINSMLL